MDTVDVTSKQVAEAELHSKDLDAFVEAKFDLLLARMDANHAELMLAITIGQNTGIHSLRSG